MKFDPPKKRSPKDKPRNSRILTQIGLEGFIPPLPNPRYHHGFRMCVCAYGPWPKLLRRQGGNLPQLGTFREPGVSP